MYRGDPEENFYEKKHFERAGEKNRRETTNAGEGIAKRLSVGEKKTNPILI